MYIIILCPFTLSSKFLKTLLQSRVTKSKLKLCNDTFIDAIQYVHFRASYIYGPLWATSPLYVR